jgi:GAF domain-containing protein
VPCRPTGRTRPSASAGGAGPARALGRAVAAAATTDDVARLVLEACADALGVLRASVCLLDRSTGELRIVASRGYPAVVSERWGSFPVTADLPASEAVRTGQPVVLRTLAERDERYPAFAAAPALQSPSVACVPFLRDELPASGVLNLSFERSRDFSARDLHLLRELARAATPGLLGRA